MSAAILNGIVKLSDRVPIKDDVARHPLKQKNVKINLLSFVAITHQSQSSSDRTVPINPLTTSKMAGSFVGNSNVSK